MPPWEIRGHVFSCGILGLLFWADYAITRRFRVSFGSALVQNSLVAAMPLWEIRGPFTASFGLKRGVNKCLPPQYRYVSHTRLNAVPWQNAHPKDSVTRPE